MGCCNDTLNGSIDHGVVDYFKENHKENSKESSQKIFHSALQKRISDILYPILRKAFVHSYNGSIDETYDIQEILGLGGISTVRRAIHIETNFQRAVKIIAKNAISETQKIMLLDEVDTLKILDHPNIIRVIEIIEDTSKLNIVTELCTGGELFERILNSRQFTENTAASYMFQILSGLIHIHSGGFIHRDLKPENILFLNSNADSPLKIIDFGVSKRISEKSKLSRLIGTAYYVAPEMIEGNINYKCDVWSCGVILYIMLCGNPPFNGNTEEVIFSKITRGVFNFSSKLWTDISKEAKDLIQKMLCKDVEKRLSAVEAWNHPWVQTRAKKLIEDNPINLKALKKLACFRATSRLQQATLQYIASNLTASQQIEELRKAFVSLDKNGDGHLSANELRLGYETISLSSSIKIDEILKNCDSDLNGLIDYNEFITATINWQKDLSHELLENAFKAYDKDKNGTISVNEIKMFLGGDGTELDSVWAKILSDADINGDGVIDLEEFKIIMLSHIEGTSLDMS
ncbi:hypothetical protein SteCoe_34334 [Stentor coeruleus]|uniref:Calcium-dependent protein kinase 1 n=1 Tax=Stentor coeruleus TaxID=5963 RepID=A0A1R2AUS5_9CILI|nr:hypothetical protein SteCoe_34334 [Stentor coeruleus]